MSRYKKGDKVAWRTRFGSPMAGTVVFAGFTMLDVERVDGGQCQVAATRCKLATPDDIENAVSEFIV